MKWEPSDSFNPVSTEEGNNETIIKHHKAIKYIKNSNGPTLGIWKLSEKRILNGIGTDTAFRRLLRSHGWLAAEAALE